MPALVEMRVLVLTNRQANQVALVRRLGERCELAGVVISANRPRHPPGRGPRLMANRIAGRTVGRAFTKAWVGMLARYDRVYDGFPNVPQIEVANINDPPVLEAIDELAPELVAVSGTNLVGQAVIDACANSRGIVNLHTGISPHVKGGPNCTNWCLARGWFHLIGNSVMWLDRGIDSGNLIATERTQLTGDESLEELQWKVMQHGHDLYLRAISAIAADQPVPDVPQEQAGDGLTFYNADWTAAEMLRARWNFYWRYASEASAAAERPVPLVALETPTVSPDARP